MENDAITPALQLLLLGGIELCGAPVGVADKLLGQSKAVALLAYLALAPAGRFQRRDRLVGLFWPELDQTHARAALRKVIYVARGLLGEDFFISRGDDDLAIAAGRLQCDVAEFTTAAESGLLARALELYRGDLMPGFFLPECVEFERWLEDERTAARERAAAASWALAAALEGDRQYTNAGAWARRSVRHAWHDERVLRRAISMLDRIGDRAGAIKLYDDFATRLRADLGVAPSPETAALVETVRAR